MPLGFCFEVEFTDRGGVKIEPKRHRRNCEFMSALSVRVNGDMGPFRQILSLRDSWWADKADASAETKKMLSQTAAKAAHLFALQLSLACSHAGKSCKQPCFLSLPCC